MPTLREVLEHSEEERGNWFYGAYFVTHVRNNTDIRTYIYAGEWNEIQNAAATVGAITGYDVLRPTYSGLARQLMQWLDVAQEPWKPTRNILPEWHYQKCIPTRGEYTMYDMKSAYWQMASHCKSPCLITHGGRILWLSVTREQQSRWDTLRSATDMHKRLRLALIGVNSVGWRDVPQRNLRSVYRVVSGKHLSMGNPVGALQPLSILAVRVTYELTQMQSENSVYSNGDCVVLPSTTVPTEWDRNRIVYTVKASGKSDVCAINAFKIGDLATKSYIGPDLHGYAVPCMPKHVNKLHWYKELIAAG